ncbi:hypothetical protein PT931_24360 [Longispora urticae]
MPIIDRQPPRHARRPSARRRRMVDLIEALCLPVVVVFSALMFAYCAANMFGWKP